MAVSIWRVFWLVFIPCILSAKYSIKFGLKYFILNLILIFVVQIIVIKLVAEIITRMKVPNLADVLIEEAMKASDKEAFMEKGREAYDNSVKNPFIDTFMRLFLQYWIFPLVSFASYFILI